MKSHEAFATGTPSHQALVAAGADPWAENCFTETALQACQPGGDYLERRFEA